MAFCKQCGAQIEDGKAFCTSCGTPVEAQQGQPKADPINNVLNTADTTAEYDPADIEKNKLFAVLSYFGLLFLVPMLAAKDSKYAQFHAKQGIVLFGAEAALWIVRFILVAILNAIDYRVIGSFFGILADIIGVVAWIASVALVVLAILGIINAVSGKAKELPLIGGLAAKIFKK